MCMPFPREESACLCLLHYTYAVTCLMLYQSYCNGRSGSEEATKTVAPSFDE